MLHLAESGGLSPYKGLTPSLYIKDSIPSQGNEWSLFIEVPVPSQVSKTSCICVLKM
jgi:hypothetical protein